MRNLQKINCDIKRETKWKITRNVILLLLPFVKCCIRHSVKRNFNECDDESRKYYQICMQEWTKIYLIICILHKKKSLSNEYRLSAILYYKSELLTVEKFNYTVIETEFSNWDTKVSPCIIHYRNASK